VDRLRREQRTISVMIELYCRYHHRDVAAPLCPECGRLLAYAERRLARCRFGEQKPARVRAMRCPLLWTRHAGEDPRGHAILRPADDYPTSDPVSGPSHGSQTDSLPSR
jgi:hypothetical protein